ncbi:gamma-glutamyl-gamma-aminobutyrate hydrolase family protein [Streptomyces sp. JJ36]|uniref:gamma-glutamyl-gamma-aminobutyrate hydrolase family protein n=1 Tax=Streptomyces sp. JJ36 TaxID=2736645 RepID=UPI001F3BD369|nr:gamma-glutamyl-gamma-aminobutyrate hydrolase family protein [Streptomyces sp. JJ36]MCF6521961.1 gamma-glutamyl-gamma-aminobutyrate hydrolase family protein [Streptomyces sp. JJ36]
MARIPLIGMTTYLADARWGAWELPATLLPAAYAQSVQAAGGHPVLLPPGDPATAAGVAARLDGVVLAGGEDVDPALYGAERHPRTDPPVPVRDRWESAVLAAALERDLPVLGICRGMQLMNVHAGGTLTQHLPDDVGHHGHNARPGVFAQHVVTTVPGTRIGELLPGATEVATHHHQAVGRLGAGLTAAAHAEDGTVEAVEFPGRTFALGVQWHPEMDSAAQPLSALIEAARQHATAGPEPVLTRC